MNFEVMVTCAVTGAGDTVGRSSHVPVTPREIAEASVEAANAGATTAVSYTHLTLPTTD